MLLTSVSPQNMAEKMCRLPTAHSVLILFQRLHCGNTNKNKKPLRHKGFQLLSSEMYTNLYKQADVLIFRKALFGFILIYMMCHVKHKKLPLLSKRKFLVVSKQ